MYMYSQETTMYTMHEQYCMYPHIFTCTCTIYMYMSICDQECNNVFSKPQKIYYVHVRQGFIQQGGGGKWDISLWFLTKFISTCNNTSVISLLGIHKRNLRGSKWNFLGGPYTQTNTPPSRSSVLHRQNTCRFTLLHNEKILYENLYMYMYM